MAALDEGPGAPLAGARRRLSFAGVIFDLDGTLVDTLEDIADAMDRVLALEGAPGHSYDAYRYLIGHGIRNLVAESLPPELRDERTIARCYERMIADYGEHSLVKTRVYDGVPELVRALRADGVLLAVHSNKADALTRDIVAALLDASDFVAVAGARPDAPLKPDPAVALAIVRPLRAASSARRLPRRLARGHAHGDGGGDAAHRRLLGLSHTWRAAGERRARRDRSPTGAAGPARLRRRGAVGRRHPGRYPSSLSRRRPLPPVGGASRYARAPASRSRSTKAGMRLGCAATTAGPRPCVAGAISTAAPASRAMSAPAA